MKFRPFGLQVIPDNWDITTVSSVANVVSRGKQPKYKNTGTMVLNQKMIQNDGIHYEFAKRHDIDKQIRPDLFLKNYDIVLNSTGTGTAGRSQIFLEKPKEKMFLDSHVTLIRPDTDKINPVFLFAQIHDSRFVKYIEDVLLAGSTGQVELSKAKVLEMPILLPPKQVQNKFGILYETIMKKQELIGTINDNLFELSKILFEAVLEDDRSELTNLANLTDIQNGFAFKSREYIGFSDTPIVRTLNIGADNLFDMQNLKYISDESRTKYQKFEFKTFDTALVMVGASIGKTGFVTSRTNGGLQNQNMWRFRPLNSEMPGLYIYNLVTYANSQMQGYKTGSAREFYTKDAFKNFEVPVGNADIYKAFFAIQDLLDNNASQTTTLTAMRDEILTQVMA